MADDWFVPGVGIEDGDRTVRLRPSKTWTRVVLELPRIPPSMNDNKIRSHWRGFHTEKKSWQEEIETLLMVERVKRGAWQRALAGCFMRFPVRVARRDPGNFAGLVNKALGDALVTYGAIADDDAAHYAFGGVEFETDLGAQRTRVVVYLQPKEEIHAPQEEG